jgi:threonine dehydrogenase-like Zn-dependent dehydrogenase
MWRRTHARRPGRIAPCGTCFFCQHGVGAQCSGHDDTWETIGGWRLGNSADGVQADYFRVPYAVAVFAQGPIGLCATAGARLKGASLIIGVDAIE